MINRQAMRGAGTKTTTKAPARTKLDKEAEARAAVKSHGKSDGASRSGGHGGGRDDGGHEAGAWRGEEVSSPRGRGDRAEQAADWAEGNEPVTVEAAVRDPDPGTYTEKGPARRPPKNDPDAAENAEEKRLSAAEEHAAQSSRRPPYGRL